jgi:hypothetical protein
LRSLPKRHRAALNKNFDGVHSEQSLWATFNVTFKQVPASFVGLIAHHRSPTW